MPNFDSDLYTLEVAATSDMSASPNAHAYGGPVLIKEAKVAIPSTAIVGDLLRLFYLPKGARVIPALSKVTCSTDPGTTLTLDVGYPGDPDAYADAIVLSASGSIAFDSTAVPPLQAKTPARLADRTLISAVVDTQASLAATTDLTFWIAYTL